MVIILEVSVTVLPGVETLPVSAPVKVSAALVEPEMVASLHV
jgi:hypothetical protein